MISNVQDRTYVEKKSLEGKEMDCIKMYLEKDKEVKEGEVITRDMLTTKGPGDGISPMKMIFILERKLKATRDLEEDVVLHDGDLA